ncbi:MAG: hypothetical protein JSV32_03805 [Dehalococcoidia bacterium]|nr:MAG: hypothetical protein JSV32_03805 [Dehalococcoidia bacterium]
MMGTVLSQVQISVTIPSQGTVIVSSPNEVWASSGSLSDIQTAVNQVQALGGGTVRVPAGVWTFDARGSSHLRSYGGINIIGAGKYLTNLTLVPDLTSYPATTMFEITGNNQLPVVISGITFIGRTQAPDTGDTAIYLNVVKNFRVTDCSFHNMGSVGVAAVNYYNDANPGWLVCQGVIDHNSFYNIYKAGAVQMGTGYGYGVEVAMANDISKVPWPENPSSLMGNPTDTTFVEDNYFEGCRHSIMSFLGGRYVVRFNTIVKPCISVDGGQWMIDAHPPRNYGNDVYGGRWAEVYNNTLTANTAGGWGYGITIDGGAAFITNNTINGNRLYYAYGFDLSTASGVSASVMNKSKPWYVYIWNNQEAYVGTRVYSPQENTLVTSGENYKFVNPATDGYLYTPYPYPHPLTLASY